MSENTFVVQRRGLSYSICVQYSQYDINYIRTDLGDHHYRVNIDGVTSGALTRFANRYYNELASGDTNLINRFGELFVAITKAREKAIDDVIGGVWGQDPIETGYELSFQVLL